jgi:hypothetical protein
MAMRQAIFGCASTMGTIMASGGIGKNELSAKETAARAGMARGLPDSLMIQS